MNWHAKEWKDVVKELETDEKRGLSEREARKRLEKYGKNVVEVGSKINPLRILLEQFTSPLVLLLMEAAIISYLVGGSENKAEVVLILSIVIANGIFGFVQDYKAERSMEALRKMMTTKAKVIRGGKVVEINADDVVVGDIILLEEGDKAPADARIIECKNLIVNESILTGESVGVEKTAEKIEENTPLAERRNMVFANTFVERGRAKAVVVATGMNTEFGKIAKEVAEAEKPPTPFEAELASLGRKISTIVLVLIAIVFAMQMIFEHLSILEALMVAIALAVAAVPEGLPAVVTIALALGTSRMVKQNALARRLSVVESLGSVNVICTDKTGTLTENRMTARTIFAGFETFGVTGVGHETKGEILKYGAKISVKSFKPLKMCILCGALCNDSNVRVRDDGGVETRGDATEIALKILAIKAGVSFEYPRLDEVPFSSERKMMSTLNRVGDKVLLFVKGAPEVVVGRCSKLMKDNRVFNMNGKERETILKKNDEMASRGLRVLAMAYKEMEPNTVKVSENDEKDLIFLGLVGMIDPPRKEVPEAVKIAKRAGIRVIMITGDNILTAKAIAKEVGIEGDAIECWKLDSMSEDEFRRAVRSCNIFARASPHHKVMILKALQEDGNIVAMTGDGVNDAPALKSADVGIAMGIRGTEVSRAASDLVLLDDNFATIVNAIKEGRTIFLNIRKFVNYLLSANLAEVLTVFILSLKGFLALTPVQLLWINLLTDGFPALALGADPAPAEIMKRKPKKKGEGVITKPVMASIAVTGLLLTFALVAVFFLGLSKNIIYAQTMLFTAFVFYEFVRIGVIRKHDNLTFFSNKWLVIALFFAITLQFAVVYTHLGRYFGVVPLSIKDIALLIILGLVLYIVNVFLDRIVWKNVREC